MVAVLAVVLLALAIGVAVFVCKKKKRSEPPVAAVATAHVPVAVNVEMQKPGQGSSSAEGDSFSYFASFHRNPARNKSPAPQQAQPASAPQKAQPAAAGSWSWMGSTTPAEHPPPGPAGYAGAAPSSSAEDTEVNSFCPRCGTKRKDDGRFCSKCGKPLDVPQSPRDGPTSPRTLSTLGQKSSDDL